ncbi:MAG TPA: hypothetical protein PLS50_09255, partial [Candidatus Dojkabacteria bacterium]|nr:hypothetical protein [Candidatus Dojkabacteria bacterium]
QRDCDWFAYKEHYLIEHFLRKSITTEEYFHDIKNGQKLHSIYTFYLGTDLALLKIQNNE